jgi:hypothetical protein
MLAIDTVLRGDIAHHNERINRDGWWRTKSEKRAPLREKLAGNLAAVADRLSSVG